jgi:hypothetical protein
MRWSIRHLSVGGELDTNGQTNHLARGAADSNGTSGTCTAISVVLYGALLPEATGLLHCFTLHVASLHFPLSFRSPLYFFLHFS